MHQTTLITESLQAATYDQNVRIGELPFFVAVTTQQLSTVSYTALLRGMISIYDSFSHALEQTGDGTLQSLWGQELHKQTLLWQDGAIFDATPIQRVPAAELGAEVLAEQIRMRSMVNPQSLLGSAYALATWYMGGTVLCDQLRQLFQISSSTGVGFLSSFDSWGQAHWPQFASMLNSVPLTPELHQQVVQAARETLDGIEQLLHSLHPINENPLSDLAMVLNPLAGNHPIAGDMTEIKALLRTHERMAVMFPYMEIRYGMRGRRFSWSDGGWLVSLTTEAQDSVNQQIRWLSRLLAARGMPQWFMECHLHLLYDELVQLLPAKRDSYIKLVETAQLLASERQTSITNEALIMLDDAFYDRVGPEWRTWMPNCGGLLASAVADENAGVAHSLSAIERWMTDPARFPATWIAAVHDIIRLARSPETWKHEERAE